MSGTIAKISSTVEIVNITPRRRWSVGEKVRLIEASMAPGQSVSLVARTYGVAPNLLYRWRKQMSEGGKTAIEANDEVVSVAEVKALKKRIRQLERVLGTKHWKWKSSKKSFALAAKKTHLATALVRRGGFPVKRVTDALAVSRSNTYESICSLRPRPERYNKAEDAFLLPLIVELLGGRQTCGYRRIQLLLNRQLIAGGSTPVNHKRVYRIMRQNNLLLARFAGSRPDKAHTGNVSTLQRNQRCALTGLKLPAATVSGCV